MMRIEDDSDDCRSLVCDQKGVIIAESVYRCMVCAKISDTIRGAKFHYKSNHIDEDEQFDFNDSCDDLFTYGNETLGKRKSSFSSHSQLRKQQMTSSLPNIISETDSLQFLCSKVRQEAAAETKQSQQAIVSREDEETHSMDNNSSPPPLNVPLARGGTTGAVGKSGYISCAVCGVIRYYSCIYRRYGQFTCQVCYRFFRTFFLKPKRYICKTLGKCPLNVRNRCRACWIKSCIGLYAVDNSRKQILDDYQPQLVDSLHNRDEASNVEDAIENGTNPMSKWTISTPSSITITSKASQITFNRNAQKSNLKSITL